ncbi:hypothetical protein GQ42DRAFT_42820 [Ramicandelaber brevisporus]|nr:hypothetical protein GQ42DRAFT_42820 [Ramicandelaber brevisporus]
MADSPYYSYTPYASGTSNNNNSNSGGSGGGLSGYGTLSSGRSSGQTSVVRPSQQQHAPMPRQPIPQQQQQLQQQQQQQQQQQHSPQRSPPTHGVRFAIEESQTYGHAVPGFDDPTTSSSQQQLQQYQDGRRNDYSGTAMASYNAAHTGRIEGYGIPRHQLSSTSLNPQRQSAPQSQQPQPQQQQQLQQLQQQRPVASTVQQQHQQQPPPPLPPPPVMPMPRPPARSSYASPVNAHSTVVESYHDSDRPIVHRMTHTTSAPTQYAVFPPLNTSANTAAMGISGSAGTIGTVNTMNTMNTMNTTVTNATSNATPVAAVKAIPAASSSTGNTNTNIDTATSTEPASSTNPASPTITSASAAVATTAQSASSPGVQKPSMTRSENILFCIDIDDCMNIPIDDCPVSIVKGLHPSLPRHYTRLNMAKYAIDNFIRVKNKINPRHKFALATLGQAAVSVCPFTSDLNEFINKLDTIQATGETYDSFESDTLMRVMDIMRHNLDSDRQSRQLQNMTGNTNSTGLPSRFTSPIDGDDGPPGHNVLMNNMGAALLTSTRGNRVRSPLVRIIVIYGRTSIRPDALSADVRARQRNDGAIHIDTLLLSGLNSINDNEIQQTADDWDTMIGDFGTSYVYDVRTNSQLVAAMTKLLAHSVQRPLPLNAYYNITSA